MYKTLAFG